MTAEPIELKLASRLEAIDEAAAAIAGIVGRLSFNEEAAFGIDIAVREAVTNAIIHGNRLDEKKFVEINVKSSPESLEISVSDQGAGFDPATVPDPTNEENILKTSGRGIFFMRNFMDEIDWLIHPEGGTTVRMIKKL